MADEKPRPIGHDRFHGRVRGVAQRCAAPGCALPGEFRAPGPRASGADGPGEYAWFCLDHIRAFNARYDYFAGMSADDILAAQHPLAGWAGPSGGAGRAFRATGSVDSPPRWADFSDPLEAISARAQDADRRCRAAR